MEEVRTRPRPQCDCFSRSGRPKPSLEFHQTLQDRESPGWLHLYELIAEAKSDRRKEFAPLDDLTDAELGDVVTLPSSIGELDNVRHLVLYGGFLERIPSAVAQLRRLREFSPYKSHRLHWLPFELIRCRKLRRTTVSTRTLYGNWKNRAPFPALPVPPAVLETILDVPTGTRFRCSVCGSARDTKELEQLWVSMKVGTDVVPLLVTTCPGRCVGEIPRPAEGFGGVPHQGGPGVGLPQGFKWEDPQVSDGEGNA